MNYYLKFLFFKKLSTGLKIFYQNSNNSRNLGQKILYYFRKLGITVNSQNNLEKEKNCIIFLNLSTL